jgi:CrcB protein
MDMMALMYVAIGGALGSMCRYLAGVGIGKINSNGFPLPTMVINITGSFLMGLWIAAMVLMLPGRARDFHLLVAVGVLGGFTTFSTFSLESYLLIEKGLWLQAALYTGGSVVLSISALFGGMWLLRALH